MHFFNIKYKKLLIYSIVGIAFCFHLCPLFAHATDYQSAAEARKLLPVDTNEIAGWPQGPATSAQAAILMDADSGTVLYAKNIHEKHYPASITKILTGLITAQQANLNDIVTFSHDAIFSVPSDATHIALDVGEELTVAQALEAMMVVSANEAANGLAEHIGGSLEGFADIMNETAKELGCVDSHFVTSNGLHDEDHYTSAYDMAQIARAYFSNELLCSFSSQPSIHFMPTSKQPDEIIEYSKNQLFPGRNYPYEYIVGSKTGYTDDARQTLVSCAEKDGMRLICVVLVEEAPSQYTDTIDLFNYGFSNFQRINISEEETTYNIHNANFFYSNNDIFGNSSPLISLSSNDYVVIPSTASFSDLVSTLSYEDTLENQIATITYTYHDAVVGTASVDIAQKESASYHFDSSLSAENEEDTSSDENIFFINVKNVLLLIILIAGILIGFIMLRAFLSSYQFSGFSGSKKRTFKLKSNKKRLSKSRRKMKDFDWKF